MTFLSWALRCFLWTSILHPSYQVIQGHSVSLKSFPQICGCPDNEGKTYNLKSLRSLDRKKPRFSVNSTEYRGYAYSYNPCGAFHLGPKNSGCQRNVAICWWVPNLTQSGDAYKTIGIQRGANCSLDDDTPVIVYQASEQFPNRMSTVRLKCAEGKKDTTTFEILDDDNWTFQLTHFWDLCPTKSPQDQESSISIPGVVAGTVGGVFGLTLLIYAVRYCAKKWNANNDNGEGRPILIDNPIGEVNPATRSRPSPIGSSNAKPDVNVIRSAHS